jgi:hypothetical protein
LVGDGGGRGRRRHRTNDVADSSARGKRDLEAFLIARPTATLPAVDREVGVDVRLGEKGDDLATDQSLDGLAIAIGRGKCLNEGLEAMRR